MTKAGFRIAICTNQSAVGRGNMSQETLDTIHQYLCEQVTQAGGSIDKIYAATDHPDASTIRRKPGPGMLLEALAEFSAEASRTPMVGDTLRDIEAAATAGCPRILTRTGNGAKLVASGVPNHVLPLTICDDLFHAAQHICEHYR
jgi:D-glycero-D-manno-heptose 1,7-bisphosphate phosphatase